MPQQQIKLTEPYKECEYDTDVTVQFCLKRILKVLDPDKSEEDLDEINSTELIVVSLLHHDLVSKEFFTQKCTRRVSSISRSWKSVPRGKNKLKYQ